ncbi:MAG: response regulator [Lachnospiraceae bacterium]|nr:response regulator [Lachnospiraceae bacterium]
MARRGKHKFSIAICDDDKRFVKHLRDLIQEDEKVFGDLGFSFYFTGYDLLEGDVTRFDLLVMDMVLPNADGRKIAQEFKKRNKKAMLVFCTGKKSPIPEDFRLGAYRYIRKEQPLQLKKDFQDTVDELYRRNAKEEMVVVSGKRNMVLYIEDILYIDIVKNGSRVHYYDDRGVLCHMEIREKLCEVYERVVPFGFEYAHNSYIVNCHKIKYWTTRDIELSDGTCLTISRSKAKKFYSACIRYIA